MKWKQFKETQSLNANNGELFINVNSRGRTFIRGTWSAIINGKYESDTKTFNFNSSGYGRAIQWLNQKGES